MSGLLGVAICEVRTDVGVWWLFCSDENCCKECIGVTRLGISSIVQG